MALAVKHTTYVPPLPCQITLLQAVPRGKIIESIIQKAVELGAHRIVPLLTERVVTRLGEAEAATKQEKWQLITIEAIKQCGAAWMPKIEMPATIAEVISRKPKFEINPPPALRLQPLTCPSSARCKPTAVIRANVPGIPGRARTIATKYCCLDWPGR